MQQFIGIYNSVKKFKLKASSFDIQGSFGVMFRWFCVTKSEKIALKSQRQESATNLYKR